jgi:isoleucyl-tRNA synthetase
MAETYKDSLNLPVSDFPMRASLPQREPERLARWEEIGIYALVREKAEGKPKYILHDGPPYANGEVHAGTALNKVLKDVIVKYKTMRGFDAPYVPGWDCHGMPIEHRVAQKLGDKFREMSTLEVRRECRAFALGFVDTMRDQFKRLGVFGLWERPYLTLDHDYEATVLDSFRGLVQKGYVYKGLRPVFWCARCETALADAEVEYRDHASHSIYVRFPVVCDPDGVFSGDVSDAYALIWTTTPWTLPANVAVAVHPRLRYLVVEHAGERYLIAEGLVDRVSGELGWGTVKELRALKGEELLNLVCRHPFLERDSVFVPADYVTLEQGTGLVHTAPGHGAEDFYTGREHDLPVLVPVDHAGRFTEEVPLWAGMNVFEANEPILEHMRGNGSLLFAGELTHSYPHCWRCKEPVIFRATEQWFLDVDHSDLRKRCLETVERVEWVPVWGRERMANMLELRPDWCLSRQRRWGVPIPGLYCTGCGELILDARVAALARDLAAEKGSDAWFTDPIERLVPPGLVCPKCGGGEFRRETDILDVWFESGVSHFAVLKRTDDGLVWPSDMYLEGSDQYRGWFQVSLLTSMALEGRPPYGRVLTHGWVLDAQGRAMHKSLGNAILPDEIIAEYGADILRLWATSADYRSDISLGEEILGRNTDAYRRIRNTWRFLLGNLHDFNPAAHAVAREGLFEIDRWALHRLAELAQRVTQAYEDLEFYRVYHLVYNFCTVDLSAVYLDVLKDRLYCSAADSPGRRAAQTALFLIADALARLTAPILVFTAEELWEKLPGEREPSVHLADWPELSSWLDEKLGRRWKLLLKMKYGTLGINTYMEEFRSKGHNSLDAAIELIPASRSEYDLLMSFGEENLKDLLIVSAVKVREPEEVPSRAHFTPYAAFKEDDEPAGYLVEVRINKAKGEKCPRCWHVEELVDSPTAGPRVCKRCADVLRSG